MIKPIFSAAMSATPYKADFMKKMGDNQQKIDEALGRWLGKLEEVVGVLKEWLGRKEAKW